MKKDYLIVFVLVILSSCENANRLRRLNPENSKTGWINAFKDNIFISCLYNSYPVNVRDSIFRMVSKYDLYNPNEDFLTYKIENRKFIDSLGSSIPKNTARFWHIEDPKNKYKNVYMSSCLHYYASRQLDSIARMEYKKYIKAVKKAGLH